MLVRIALIVVLTSLAFGPSAASAQRYVGRYHGRSAERAEHGAASGIFALLVVGVSAGIGGGIGYAAADPCTGWCIFPRWNGAVHGLAVGASVAFALLPAVYTLIQSGFDGRGDAGGAYLGWLMGAAVGGTFALVGYVVDQHAPGDSGMALMVGGAVVGALLAFIGTIVGYQRSADRGAARVDVAAHAGGFELIVSGTL